MWYCLKKAFAENLLEQAEISSDSGDISKARKDNYEECFVAEKGINTAEITAEWKNPVTLRNIVLKENILCGQRVESFIVEAEQEGNFTEVYRGTVIGYKRIVPLNELKTKAIRIKITDSRTEPTLAFFGVY